MEQDLFTTIFAMLGEVLDTYVHEAVRRATDYVDGPIEIMATLTVIGTGAIFLMGMSVFPLKELLKTFAIVALVFALAGNVGHYNAYLGDFLHDLPNEFLHIFAVGDAPSTDQGIGETLDDYATTAMDGIYAIWSAGGMTDLGWYLLAIALAGLFVAFGVAVCVALGIAMVGSSLVVGIGPIMILGLLHKSTHEYFTRWVSYALQFALLAAFVGSVLGILQEVLDRYLAILTQQSDNIDLNELLAPAVILALGAFIFGQLPNMASSLSGGIGLAVGNSAWRGLSKATQATVFHMGGKYGEAYLQAGHRRRIESSVQARDERARGRREAWGTLTDPNRVDGY